MNTLKVFFCCAALALTGLAITGCALDDREYPETTVVAEDPVAERLLQAHSDREEIMSSLRQDDDGQFTSDLGPVEVTTSEGDATARKLGGGGETDLRRVCWQDEGGYWTCCQGTRCCFYYEGQEYCG